MRKATELDIPQLTQLYNEAFVHAKNVGDIDWQPPFDSNYIRDLMADDSLYRNVGDAVSVAVKLTNQPDMRIWHDLPQPALYISRLATSDAVRGADYVERCVLPFVFNLARPEGRIRGDCLADNERLRNFYIKLGATSLGNVTFYSEKLRRELEVTRLEVVL